MSDKAYGIGGGNWTYDWGHTTLNEYSLTNNAWTSKTACTYVRSQESSGAGGYIDGYVFGGSTGGESPYGSKKTEKYSIANNSWTIKTDQPKNDGNGSRPEAIVGHIYLSFLKWDAVNEVWKWCITIEGGCQVCGIGSVIIQASYNNSYKYTPAEDSKAAIASFPENKAYANGFGDGTYGYICGGGSNPSYSSCHRYDIAGDSWASRASMGAAGGNNATFVISGSGHSFGGYTYPNSSTNYHGRYDNVGNSWTSKASYPSTWSGICGFYPIANLPPNAPTGLSITTS